MRLIFFFIHLYILCRKQNQSMDSFDDDPFKPSSSSSCFIKDDENLENIDQLLDEGWFFGGLLTSKSRMLRCFSDPSPNFDKRILSETPNYTIKSSSSHQSNEVSETLNRAPSLPPCLGRMVKCLKEENSSSSYKGMSKEIRQLSDQSEGIQEKEIQNKESKVMTGKPSKHKLLRTPSLPPCIGKREELIEEYDDSDITMSRLIRQAMPHLSEILPPRHTPKEMTQCYSMPKYRPPRNYKDLGYTNQSTIKKSQKDYESQEVQGFKDLGFTFKKQDLNPSLQQKKKQNQEQDNNNNNNEVKRPYIYEAWHSESSAPSFPNWATQNSAEDMKVQLKYWARAVASNMR